MDTLQLVLLGIPELRQNGQLTRLRTRKMLALLAYLAVEPGPHTREELAELLWPSVSGQSRASLRLALHHIQGQLRDAALLHVTHDTVELPRQPDVWVDVLELDTLAADHTLPPTPGIFDLWRGSFLQGQVVSASPSWDDWIQARGQAYAERFDGLLARLAYAQLASGHAWDAVFTAQRRIRHDILNQDAYRQLARAQRAAGLDSAADDTERLYEEVLQRELGVVHAPVIPAARLRQASPARLEELPHFLVGEPLIGRQLEFGHLVRAYRLAAAGTPQVALLNGEPGIGKTRLAGELLAWAQARQAPVLHSRSTEIPGPPFAPMIEALQREVGRLHHLLDANHLSELAQLMPNLLNGPLPPTSGDARIRLMEALSAAVQSLKVVVPSGESLVLLIDDLQWADTSSLDALLYLVARLTETPAPLLLLLTARTENLGHGSHLDGWLSRIRRLIPLTAVTLGPLGADDTRHLVNGAVARAPTRQLDRLSAWLFGQTGGHPLYLTETIKSVMESGAVRVGTGGVQVDEARLPNAVEGVRAAIAERLARLSPAALALAQTAAVLGRGATFEVLHKVAELDDDAALAGYEELLRCGLLRELDGIEEKQATLSHDRVRETLQAALSAPRRQGLHRRAFRTLKTLMAPPVTLAEYAALGGLKPEAAVLFEDAAADAKAVGAYGEALESLERALNLVPTHPARHEHRFRLLLAISDILFTRDAGLSSALLERIGQAADRAGAAGLLAEQAAALTLLAADQLHSGRLSEARVCAQQAYRAAATTGHRREEARALIQQARVETAHWEWRAAETYGEKAMRLAGSLGADSDDLALFARLVLLINDRWATGALRSGRMRLASLLPMAREVARREAIPHQDQSNALHRLLWELIWQDLLVGAYSEAHEHLDELASLRGRPQETLLTLRGLIALRQGDLQGALASSEAAVELTERFHLKFPNVYSVRAACLLQHGDLEEARQALALGRAANLNYTHIRDRAQSALHFGEALIGLGDLEGAQQEYDWVLHSFSLPHVLGALRGTAEVKAHALDGREAALCCGAVLAHGGAGVYEEQRAHAVVERLRLQFPTGVIDDALAKGAALPLRELVERVTVVFP